MQKANVGQDAGILDANDKDATMGQGNIHQTVGVYARPSAVTLATESAVTPDSLVMNKK
ncbi:MAG: hypothetical protein ABIR84_09325 [Candidatus Nitrotoga sp.]